MIKRIFVLTLSILLSIQLIGCSNQNTDMCNSYRLGDIISYNADKTSLECLISTDDIKVNNDKYITFTPTENVKSTGFIFYPGGLVEPEAYAPVMKQIAEQGYTVVVVKMPINLAVLNFNRAEDVISEYSNIDSWVIGGHSLGGVMACKYAAQNDKIRGVVLYASYPQNDSLKDANIEILSLWGSEDKVASIEKIIDGKDKVNSNSKFIEIKGGNHAHFGDYGEQKGDGESTITAEEQWLQTAKYTVGFLDTVES